MFRLDFGTIERSSDLLGATKGTFALIVFFIIHELLCYMSEPMQEQLSEIRSWHTQKRVFGFRYQLRD